VLGDTKFKVIDDLSQMAELGVSAGTIANALEPIMDRRLGQLLDKLQQCPPELGPIIDIKAQIGEVWRIRKELNAFKSKGQSAIDALNNIVSGIQSKGGNGNAGGREQTGPRQ
jgi:hypothetical protein